MKITLKELTKWYPGRTRKEAGVTSVNRFDFVIPSGKLVSLLGPSGCGKSTTLLMISGLEKPTSGRIFFYFFDVTNIPPEARGVGLVFQNYALYPHMTVEQNIMFPLGNLKGDKRLSKEEMKRRALEAGKLVQIDSLMNRRPKELSGGQQQRVAIARALVKMPRVLLMDEPLSNLDARLRLQTRVEIRRIQRETGLTTIFVTHDQEEAMSISDFIVVMKEGVMQQIGSPQSVYDDPHNLFVAKFLGTPPINVFAGRIKDGQVYIGDNAVFPIAELDDEKPDFEPELAQELIPAGNGAAQTTAGQSGTGTVPHPAHQIRYADDAGDCDVWVGIRPEGFILDPEGPLILNLGGVEVMGRDITVVSRHPDFQGETIRSIIDAQSGVDVTKKKIRMRIRPGKLLVFDKQTEERLYGRK